VDISITFLTGLDIDGEYSIISVGFKLSNGVALLGLKYSAFTFLSLTLTYTVNFYNVDGSVIKKTVSIYGIDNVKVE
jgi:hypothetical protein